MELEVWAVVRHLSQVLETKLGSSAKLRPESIGNKLQPDMVTIPALGRGRRGGPDQYTALYSETVSKTKRRGLEKPQSGNCFEGRGLKLPGCACVFSKLPGAVGCVCVCVCSK